jgi:hypothetical protein
LSFFGHKKEIQIPFDSESLFNCKCITCPVQANSPCAQPKIAKRNDLVQNPQKLMEQMTTPGMMKNMDMIRGMNYEQVKSMSREQMQAMSEQMNKNVPKQSWENMAPKPEDLPGPYCVNGIASCKDFDFTKQCMCSSCQIFNKYNLEKAKPNLYFCKDGKPMK